MHRLLRITAVAVLFAILAPASYLAYYDLAFFQPAWSNTRQLLRSSSSAQPSSLVKQQLRQAYSRTLQFHAAAIVLRQSEFGGGDGWRHFAWGKLVDLHLSEHEQMSVVASLAYMGGERYGFAAASRSMFARPIDQLSPAESATLVALVRAPSYYESRPEKLVQHRDRILAQAGSNALSP